LVIATPTQQSSFCSYLCAMVKLVTPRFMSSGTLPPSRIFGSTGRKTKPSDRSFQVKRVTGRNLPSLTASRQ
jgi:hypothetical protein